MRLRRDDSAKPPPWGNFGIACALEYGGLRGAFDDEPVYTLAEVRAAWAAYRDRFEGRAKPWAAYVFDDGLSVEEADRIIATRRSE